MDKKDSISNLVKDPVWQKVRESLLGKWTEEPEKNCKKLREYLGSLSSTKKEKLRIVMNYLTGTGFRTGNIKHPCIQKLRTEISLEIKIRKAKGNWY